MWRTTIVYGLSFAALIFLLKFLEYRYIIRTLSIEVYLGLVSLFFTALGVWVGLKLTRKKIVHVGPDFQFNQEASDRLGISKRELEVLQLMAGGLSNQEIADKLFVSLNTVKTHSSNLFLKLEVSRRTQAVQKAKEMRLIP
jgi:DNA-binding CsgD family transcriptional regulator